MDEIGELSLAAQVRLLRVLQQKIVTRIGGMHSIPVDFRLVAATHRDLKQMAEEGRFRNDLLYRLESLSSADSSAQRKTGRSFFH